ncbi:vWA domain-containing protein [Jannaschia formosa]|uniref:vWA domain-containing protein n=1 Tax=Jannaschia formosa TaxID=2259592 RepID=UPI000E1BBBB8|nr:VWA domain-containing protein [Jannaschia formosa]TFL19562.1 VWA domain-containing protein [Jannaschia formosa]
MWRAVLPLALGLSLEAQAAGCAADAMVVFDASASMTSQDFDGNTIRRIDEARAAVAEVMPRIERTRRIGLVTYGAGPGECDGISVRFPPIADAAGRLTAEVAAVRPGGLTPLTTAVRTAAEALGPGIVILVTDGQESCGGAPCALARALPADLTVHVIGFKLDWTGFARTDARPAPDFSGRCLAEQTGGLFVSTRTVQELVAALQTTLGCDLIGRGEPRPASRVSPT